MNVCKAECDKNCCGNILNNPVIYSCHQFILVFKMAGKIQVSGACSWSYKQCGHLRLGENRALWTIFCKNCILFQLSFPFPFCMHPNVLHVCMCAILSCRSTKFLACKTMECVKLLFTDFSNWKKLTIRWMLIEFPEECGVILFLATFSVHSHFI